MHILVVISDAAVRHSICHEMRSRGHDTASCASVEAAQTMLPYVDVVISRPINWESNEWLMDDDGIMDVMVARTPETISALLEALERQEAVR